MKPATLPLLAELVLVVEDPALLLCVVRLEGRFVVEKDFNGTLPVEILWDPLLDVANLVFNHPRLILSESWNKSLGSISNYIGALVSTEFKVD